MPTSAKTCYFPNGEESTDVPCNSTASVSSCCGNTKACLTNGLCALEADSDTGINYARGSCTDRNWNSDVCPQVCLINQDSSTNSSAYDFQVNGVQVWECGNQGYGKQAEYCCESQAERQRCCSTSTAVFRLESATIGYFTGDATLPLTTSTSTTPVSSTVSMTSAGGSGISTTLLSQSTGPTATSTPTLLSSPKNTNTAAKIGGSIGGVFGVLLIIAVSVGAIVWFKRRRNKRNKTLQQYEPDASYKPELDGTSAAAAKYQQYPLELTSNRSPVELQQKPQVHELPSNDAPHELPVRNSVR